MVGNNRYKLLVKAAIQARKNAYCPYSRFKVGAAVLAAGGKIYAGANVENASYGLTMCAERVAVGCAAAHGERRLIAVAVVYDPREFAVPCGACLQVLREFGDDMEVVMANTRGRYAVKRLSELLPSTFSIGKRSNK